MCKKDGTINRLTTSKNTMENLQDKHACKHKGANG